MPIKGISEIERLGRIGKIRLGVKAKNAKGVEYPTSTDYFVIDPDDESIAEQIREVYGEKPKALDVIFAVDDIEQVFPQYLKRYSFNTLVCKGDGEKGIENIFEKKADGTVTRTGDKEVKCEGCPYNDRKKCKPVANLMVMLPKILGIGIWQCDTSSFHSIVGINAGLKLVRQMYKRISGVPLRLLLNPKVVKADGRAKTVYVMSLSIEGTLQQALKENAGATMITEGDKAAKSLMPKPDESHEEILIADEGIEEHEEQPIEELTKPEEVVNEVKVEVKPEAKDDEKTTEEKRKAFRKQAAVLKYSPEQMVSYIDKVFKRKSTDAMSGQELDMAITHLGNVIYCIEHGLKVFDRKELEDYAKNICKVDNIMMMNGIEIERYIKLLDRSIPKEKK